MILKTNNSKAISRLSKRMIKENKSRNLYIVSAVLLSTFLLTFIFTAGLTFYNSYTKYNEVQATGIESDGEFYLSKEEFIELTKNPQVIKGGFFRYASMEALKNKEFLGRNVLVKAAESNDVYDMQFIRPTDGDYPKTDNEALVPKWVIEALGLDVKVGVELPLELSVNGEIQTIKVKVSGYYEPLIPQASGMGEIFVTPSFIEKYNKEALNVDGTAYVKVSGLNKYSSKENVDEKLKAISKTINSAEYKVSERYKPADEMLVISGGESIFYPIIFGVILIVLSGYLLIYNVFYISVIRDTRFYGQLKTLGATSKQIKSIIYKNAMLLSSIAIPMGLILGYLIGRILTPTLLKYTILGNFIIVENSVWPFVLATLFALLTVLISCRKPGRIAAKVSPIEATKYNSTDLVNATKTVKKGKNGAKVHKMALANMIKNKKKVFISSMSMAISATIVIFAITVWLGFDQEEHINRYNLADITVKQNIQQLYGEKFKSINPDLIDKLKALDNVEEINEHYALTIVDDWGITYFKGRFSVDASLKKEFEQYELSYMFNKSPEGLYETSVSSIKAGTITKEAKRLKLVDGTIDAEKFKTGKYIIVNRYDQKITDGAKVGDKIKIEFYVDDEIISEEFEIMAIVAFEDENYTNSSFSAITIEEDKYKSLFKDYNENIKDITLNVKDGYEKEVESLVKDIILKENNNQIALDSRLIWQDSLSGVKNLVCLASMAAAFIFGVIGLLNVINTLVTSIIVRIREFATLEAIGMTKKQQKQMLIFEGLYYVVICTIIIIPLGLGAALMTPNMIPIYGGFNIVGFITTILVIIFVFIILMTCIPLVAYRSINKISLVDRIKED